MNSRIINKLEEANIQRKRMFANVDWQLAVIDRQNAFFNARKRMFAIVDRQLAVIDRQNVFLNARNNLIVGNPSS